MSVVYFSMHQSLYQPEETGSEDSGPHVQIVLDYEKLIAIFQRSEQDRKNRHVYTESVGQGYAQCRKTESSDPEAGGCNYGMHLCV